MEFVRERGGACSDLIILLRPHFYSGPLGNMVGGRIKKHVSYIHLSPVRRVDNIVVWNVHECFFMLL